MLVLSLNTIPIMHSILILLTLTAQERRGFFPQNALAVFDALKHYMFQKVLQVR